jgi:hypothetical protein
MTTPPAHPRFYFASTTLDLRQTFAPDTYPDDLFIGDVCFRKVDPPYLAWLRRRMESAKRRFEAGQMPQAAWESLRSRFNGLQAWAVEHYGREALGTALRQFNPATYVPPANRQPPPYLFPETGCWKFSEPVSPEAVRKVDAIRDTAMAQGWSEARLYQNRGRLRFPLGPDYGLVCFLGPDATTGVITETHIEVVHTRAGRSHTLRFSNPDVFPPRSRKDTPAA